MPKLDTNDNQVKLTEIDLKLVAFIEEHFWTSGQASSPPVAEVVEGLKLPEKVVIDLLENVTIREYLTSRSIPNPLEALVDSGGLTAHQLFLANVLMNIQDKNSFREKLKMCSVSPQQYYVWMADPRFSNYIQRRIEQVFKASGWQVDAALLNSATAGDNQAMKLYYELTGKLNKDINININTEGILSQVVEIVSHYVSSEIMKEIAADIEVLIQTGQAPQPQLINTIARELASGV